MKAKILSLMLFTVCLYISTTQAQQPNLNQHYLSFGPRFNYNLEQKKALFGGGIDYEFRLNKNWGFTADANINIGLEKKGQAIFLNSKGANLLNIASNNFSIGSRFYFNRFYVSANFGYGEERQKTQYADVRGIRWESKRGFYQGYSVGYQIPIQTNNLEIFAGGGGVKDLNITTGVRFKFGLGKK